MNERPNQTMGQMNIVPIEKRTTTEQLAAMWLDTKRIETEATSMRVAIEKELIERVGYREEGSRTTELADGTKVVTTGKLNYKVTDFAAFKSAIQGIDEELRPIKVVESVDETGVKWLRANAPKAYALIAETLTITPAKTSVTVKAA